MIYVKRAPKELVFINWDKGRLHTQFKDLKKKKNILIMKLIKNMSINKKLLKPIITFIKSRNQRFCIPIIKFIKSRNQRFRIPIIICIKIRSLKFFKAKVTKLKKKNKRICMAIVSNTNPQHQNLKAKHKKKLNRKKIKGGVL